MSDGNGTKCPEWFTIKQAAEYLAVGEPTLYRWMREGKITYRKIGDSTRFLQQDLDAVVHVYPSEQDAGRVTEFCPICHHEVLVDGDIRSTGLAYFHPAKSKFWTLKDSNVQTNAKMCARCGFIALRGNVDKLNALKQLKDATPVSSATPANG
jgi:excisionase family DNA binding protein